MISVHLLDVVFAELYHNSMCTRIDKNQFEFSLSYTKVNAGIFFFGGGGMWSLVVIKILHYIVAVDVCRCQ